MPSSHTTAMVQSKHLASTLMDKQITEALERVKRLLDATRDAPIPAKDSHTHTYADKYTLCDVSTNACVSCALNCMRALGMSEEHLQTMVRWVREDGKRVSLAFKCDEACAFATETTRDVEDPTR